jgi:hypothetical protein
MSCADVRKKQGIADKEYFWVRIYNDGCKYHVDAVREDERGEPVEDKDECHPMITLTELCNTMRERNEVITEMQSVEIHIVRIQHADDIGTPNNRKCVVNSRRVSC